MAHKVTRKQKEAVCALAELLLRTVPSGYSSKGSSQVRKKNSSSVSYAYRRKRKTPGGAAAAPPDSTQDMVADEEEEQEQTLPESDYEDVDFPITLQILGSSKKHVTLALPLEHGEMFAKSKTFPPLPPDDDEDADGCFGTTLGRTYVCCRGKPLGHVVLKPKEAQELTKSLKTSAPKNVHVVRARGTNKDGDVIVRYIFVKDAHIKFMLEEKSAVSPPDADGAITPLVIFASAYDADQNEPTEVYIKRK